MPFVYEPQYRIFGWGDDSGSAIISWLDRDLADPVAQAPFLSSTSTFFSPTLTISVLATTFMSQNIFFIPVVKLLSSDARQMLKNEVRRTRMLTGPGL